MSDSQNRRAIGFMLSSTLSLSITGVLAKYLSMELSSGNLTLLRFLVPAILLFVFLSFTSLRLPPKSMWRLLAFRALSIAACQLCFIYALTALSLVESVVLFGTGPLFIALFEKLFFRVHLSGMTIVSLLLTSVGVLLLAGEVGGLNFKPEILIGLLSGVFNAGSQLSLHKASKGSMSGIENNAWTFLFAGIGLVPVLLFIEPTTLSHLWHSSTANWGVIIMLLLMAVMVINTQTSRYKAYQLATTNSQVAPLIYTNLVFTALWQFTLFDVVFSASQLIGLLLIVIANLLSAMLPRWMGKRKITLTPVKSSN
ncbi:DMT family transporter [Vibrio sp. 10N.261.51.F12]|uniref:DMT family transporter n=1 Tax=Vibrio sp. 10N.261.51.F12 TaxID=3229679 RepID=UPI00354CAB87